VATQLYQAHRFGIVEAQGVTNAPVEFIVVQSISRADLARNQ
jgi:hypothetical protein